MEVNRFPFSDNVVSQMLIDGQNVSIITTPKVCYFVQIFSSTYRMRDSWYNNYEFCIYRLDLYSGPVFLYM